MPHDGRSEFRRSASLLLQAFVAAVEKQQHGKPITARELDALVGPVMASPAMVRLLDQEYPRLQLAVGQELLIQKRGDPLQRLITHPLAPAFADETLSRDILSNYFHFIQSVLGAEREALAHQAAELLLELKEAWPEGFTWDAFYDDNRAKLILWVVLVRIEEAFRRFDIRRDWLITLMQNTPQSISLSSNAFIPRHPSATTAEAKPFGTKQFNSLFACLFGPMRSLSQADRILFERSMGVPPQTAFGTLWANLERCGALT